MKNLYNTKNWKRALLLLPLLLLLAVSACRDELTAEEFEASELSLKTSDIAELLPNLYNSKYTFSWTAGNNMGTNSSISYKLEFDKKGNNFANAQVYEVGKNVYSHDVTIGELNKLLVKTYGATPGSPIDMEAKITATFGDSSVPEKSAVTDFTLTPFKPFTDELYIVGSATPNGWDISNATALTATGNPGEFVYSGQLKNGNFKFTVSQDGCWCQDFYTRDPESDNKIVYNEGGSGADLQWINEENGLYRITVNVLELTIKKEKIEEPPFSKLWIVGSASPSEWEINNPVGFVQDTDNPFIFSLECSLKPGTFKILAGSTGDWCGDWYRPMTDKQAPVNGAMQQLKGCDPDLQWEVTAGTAGRYKIIVNTADNTIKFEPVNVYIIGDATPNGWNMGTLTPMTKNGSVYTWTGTLTAGSFKFTKFNTTWCDGVELVAETPNQSISNTKFKERARCEGGDATDNKWVVTGADAGVKTFTLNLETNTLTIE